MVVNAGSTSIKYALFEEGRSLMSVQYDKTADGCKRTFDGKESMHDAALFEATPEDIEKLANIPVAAYGFRVVHGGHILDHTVLLNDNAIAAIEEAAVLAPLHNYACLALIHAWRTKQPAATFFAVFDTAFHRTLPEHAATYDIPERFRTQHHIRRYGFHGISCQSVLRQLEEVRGSVPERIIICHLGGGCSITAVHKGKSVDTSMGFSPLEGLMMASRTGDIDSGAVFHMASILREEGMSWEEADKETQRLLQKEGGLKAIAGTDSMLDVLHRCEAGDTHALLARTMFVYHVQKYIGAYTAVLGGVDAIIFTGGIGFGSDLIRQLCSAPFAGVPTYAIKAEEEVEIARQGRTFL